jgi:hypothetical protein
MEGRKLCGATQLFATLGCRHARAEDEGLESVVIASPA